ncbi:MAG: hypothetical protein K6G51_07890 [Sphaerochaetaceae bacterium]|nr:hypothetical protein [Sphaerochaetaceae bacterium]
MTERDARNMFTPAKKLLIFSFILILFVLILLPVFQMGKNYEYRMKINAKESQIAEMESSLRELRCNLAQQKAPETLLDDAYIEDSNYEVVNLASVVRVARGNV